MTFLNKCLAVAMSALFAATPVVPAGAMPLSVTKVQQVPTTNGSGIHLVRETETEWIRRRYRGNRGWREHRGWRGDRGWRESRRYRYRDRDDWRGDRGYRYGWYRGHRGYRYHRHGYRYHDGFWFPLAAFGIGTIVGGAIANDRGYVGGGSHVNWCANRYRSYRAYDNTFQPYYGPRRQCISPYS